MTVDAVAVVADADQQESMRVQTECNLGVRFTWDVTGGHHHPRHTYTCVQDVAMAATAAIRAAENAPRGVITLVDVDVSPSSGRFHPWEPLELEFSEDGTAGWLSGACA
jgi:hypothetical protein